MKYFYTLNIFTHTKHETLSFMACFLENYKAVAEINTPTSDYLAKTLCLHMKIVNFYAEFKDK